MEFQLTHVFPVLERTPRVIDVMLRDLPVELINSNEGPEAWSPYDVVGHLIHGEQTNWVARVEIILSDAPERKFEHFDRFAQFKVSGTKSLATLLDEFAQLRERNLKILRAKHLGPTQFARTGTHPALGPVTLANLLSTWAAHDLNHVAQINRVIGRQFEHLVGPWKQYLGIMRRS